MVYPRAGANLFIFPDAFLEMHTSEAQVAGGLCSRQGHFFLRQVVAWVEGMGES